MTKEEADKSWIYIGEVEMPDEDYFPRDEVFMDGKEIKTYNGIKI